MRLIKVGLVSLLLFAACSHGDVLGPESGGPDLEAWVATDPVQCLGNPWERDWLASHDWDYDAYPDDPTTPGLEPEEIAIIRDFYRRQGVVVLEVVMVSWSGVVCAACSCPQGYTLFLRVRPEDVPTIVALGFREESPR